MTSTPSISHNTYLNNIQKAFSKLLLEPVWVCSNMKEGKVPYSPVTLGKARSNDPTTWGTFSQAQSFIEKNPGHCPAIALSSHINLVAIDLDNCIDGDGCIQPWAQQLLNEIHSYTEISVSGSGIHIFANGKKPGDECKKATGQRGEAVEMYENKKFITLTGNIIPEKPIEIRSEQEGITKIYNKTFPEKETVTQAENRSPSMTDDEIISLCRKAKNATKFTALYDKGDLSAYNKDKSAADLALLSILGFYTQDTSQLDRLFRSSKLMLKRDKWEREDYRERTSKKAIDALKEVYKGRPICDTANGADSHKKPIKKEALQKPKEDKPTIKLRTVGIENFLSTPIQERPYILTPWCREQNTIMIHAWRGLGKTWFALNIAYAIASGGEFLGWKAINPRKVLYIDGEMPAIALQERLANIVQRNAEHSPPGEEFFQLLASDLQEVGIPYLDSPEGQELVRPFIEKADVIVLDNLSALTCQPENESQSWIPMQYWILELRRAGKTVIMVHHSGKGGAQRGNSKKEDILDIVINLKKPKDYAPEHGARFELHFEKARGLSGKCISPREIRTEQRNGILYWTHSELDTFILERIKEMTELGMKDAEIYAELDIPRSSYYRHKKKLKERNPI